MCGIIAVVRRPGGRPRQPPTSSLAALDRGRRRGPLDGRPVAAGLLDRGRPRLRRPTACCGACPGVLALARPARRWRRPSTARLDAARRAASPTSRRGSTADADGPADARGASTPRCVALKDALWAVRQRPAAHRRAPSPSSPARDAGAGRARRLPRRPAWRCRRSTGSRCAAATRPASTCSCGTTGSTSTTPSRRRPARRPRRRPAVPVGRGAGSPTASLSFVYKAAAEIGELGDNTARAARRDRAPTTCCAWRWPRRRRGSPCSATPAGPASASSPSPTPTRSTSEEDGADSAGPYVVGRAQRRRRQPRRPQGGATACASPAPITTDAKVIPALVARARRRTGVDLAEAFRRTVAAFEGSVAIGAAQRGRARPGAARAAGQRPGALRRPGRGRFRRRQRAVRRWSRRPPRYLRLDGETPARADEPPAAARSSCSTADAPATLDGIRRLAYDGTELPVDRRRRRARPRSRPATSTAATSPHFLLKEITEAPDELPQDAARQASSSDDGLLRADRRRRARCRRRVADRLADRRDHAGARASARAPRPSPAQSLAARARPAWSAARPRRARPSRPPSCPASGCAPT